MLVLAGGTPVAAQITPDTLRPGPIDPSLIDEGWLESLSTPPLDFDPPAPEEYAVSGVTVFFLPDSALPLVDVHASFEGGYGDFPREYFAAALALPALLRSGGTQTLPPDSVDILLEALAVETGFGGSGGGISSSINTLTDQLDPALELWGNMLARPQFDSARVEIWRDRERESIRRSGDDPASLAFAAFNRLLYGDHSIGWQMEPADLAPDRFDGDALHQVHRRLICRDRMILGASGDLAWDELRPRLERLVARIEPCDAPLPDPPIPEVGADPGVYVIPRDLEQSTIVMAQPVGLREGPGEDYFASRIGNSILGAGGLSSRLMQRVRTERGLAYGVSSLWTTPRRSDGLLGAVVRTGPETTVEAIGLILETMAGMADAPPSTEEVRTQRQLLANGWVFNFDRPGVVVSRRMALRLGDLPDDWLERYLEGVQAVEPAMIRETFDRWLELDRMVILIVGDPARIGPGLERFGPVRTLEGRDPPEV